MGKYTKGGLDEFGSQGFGVQPLIVQHPGNTGGGTGHGGGGGVGLAGGGGGAPGGSSGGRPGNGRTGGGIWEQSGLHIHQVVSDCWKHTE